MVKSKQDRQCTHNVTLRRVYETTVTVEKQLVLHILCACERIGECMSVLACMCVHGSERVALIIQHATYMRHIACGLLPYNIFRHHLINGTILGKRGFSYKICSMRMDRLT